MSHQDKIKRNWFSNTVGVGELVCGSDNLQSSNISSSRSAFPSNGCCHFDASVDARSMQC